MESGDLAVSAEASSSGSLDCTLIEIRQSQIRALKDLNKRGPGPHFLSPERDAEPTSRDAAIIALTASGKLLDGALFVTPAYCSVSKMVIMVVKFTNKRKACYPA